MTSNNTLNFNAKKITGNLVVLVAAVAMLGACGSPQMGSESGASISGKLVVEGANTNARTSPASNGFLIMMPIPAMGWQVDLVDANGNVVQSINTDFTGSFSFTNVPQGDYTVVIYDMNGFFISSVNISLIDGDVVMMSGNATTDSATWVIEYAPAPAPTDPAPAPTDPAPAPTDPAPNFTAEDIKRANQVSELTGIPAEDILAMRAAGMGWGQIAKEFGLHPGDLGWGHDNGNGGNGKKK